MIDVVMPNGNEGKLIEMAERLGFSDLCLIYGRFDEGVAKGIEGLRKKANIPLYTGSFGSPNSDIVFGDVSREDINALVENKRIDALCGFESLRLKDRLKQKSSGLDPVLCKLMSERKKIYCVDFGSILQSSSKAVVFARLKQNLMLCRKFRIEVMAASFASSPLKMRNPLDIAGFLAVMGHDNGKMPFNMIEKRIILNAKKREGKMIREGVERD